MNKEAVLKRMNKQGDKQVWQKDGTRTLVAHFESWKLTPDNRTLILKDNSIKIGEIIKISVMR